MNYFNDPHYFDTEFVFRSLCKLHFLLADSHMLPDKNLDRRDSKTLPLDLHTAPYSEDVSIGHSRRCYTCGRVDCVIVSLDKFRHIVYIAVRILERKLCDVDL